MEISLGGLPAVLRLTESTKVFFTMRFCGTESIDPLLSKKGNRSALSAAKYGGYKSSFSG